MFRTRCAACGCSEKSRSPHSLQTWRHFNRSHHWIYAQTHHHLYLISHNHVLSDTRQILSRQPTVYLLVRRNFVCERLLLSET